MCRLKEGQKLVHITGVPKINKKTSELIKMAEKSVVERFANIIKERIGDIYKGLVPATCNMQYKNGASLLFVISGE